MKIKNALIPIDGKPARREISVENGVIASIGVDLPDSGEEIDAEGLLVLPGAIDPHVHFFDPGYTHKESFATGSAAAAAGGITTVIDMPDTSIPMAIDGQSVQKKREHIESQSVVDFGLFGGVSGKLFDSDLERRVAEMAPLVMAIKTYATSGADFFPRVNNYQYAQLLPLARDNDVMVLVHAEDWDYVSAAADLADRSVDSPRAFYDTRPELAETLSVLTVTEIARQAGARMHIVHLGTTRAAEIVAGLEHVSGETCPQYLEFDVTDFERIGAPLKITPPVKGPEHKARLWQMLADGGIDFIASDHAPGTADEKSTGSIWTDYSGIPGGPVLFMYALSEGYLSGRLTLERLIEITSTNAAKRYRFCDRKGSIDVGKDADFVFVDPNATTTFSAADSPSLGKVSPWDGRTFMGRVKRTILRGQSIYDDINGVTGVPGDGTFLAPTR